MATRDLQSEISFSLGDLIAVAKRRFWWFAIPAALGIGAGLAVAMAWPPVYEAGSIVVVESQGVPEDLVRSTVVTDTEARFGQIKLHILARDNLSAIIDEFKLYADEGAPMEQRVEQMRSDIAIEPLPPAVVDPRARIEIESFRIAYRGGRPQVVADVANRLTRDFLSQNLRERASQAEGTSEFIDAELLKTEGKRARLAQELMQYRDQHQGELPENLPANTQRLERLDQTYRDGLTRLQTAQTQVTEIRRQIRELRISGSDESADPVARKRQLELVLNRDQAEGKTDKHPDVIIAQAELERLQAMIDASLESDVPVSPAESQLRTELRGFEVRVQVLTKRLDSIQEQIAEVEERIANTPSRAAQVSELQARFVSLTDAIRELQQKKAAADLGQSVELVQKGEKFRVVESAVPPTSPVYPNRPLVAVVGAILGMGMGLFLLVVREMADQSFHSAAHLQAALELPVLGAIPVIRLPAEFARTRARMRRLLVMGVVILALIAGGGLAFYFYTNMPTDDGKAQPAPAALERPGRV